MQILSVNYELKKPGGNYDKLYETLKSYNCAHPMTSFWLIKTTESITSLYEKIKACLDTNDLLLVDSLSPNHYGYLPKDVIDWLNN